MTKNLSLSQKFIMNTMQETRKSVVINRKTNWNKFQVYTSLVKRGLVTLVETRGDDHIFALANEPAAEETNEVVSVPNAPEIPAAQIDEGVSIVADCQHCKFRAATQVIDDFPYCDVCADNIRVQPAATKGAEKPKREKKAKVEKTAESPVVSTISATLHIQPKGGAEKTEQVSFDVLKPSLARAFAAENSIDQQPVRMWLEGADYGYDVRWSDKKARFDEWKFHVKPEVK